MANTSSSVFVVDHAVDQNGVMTFRCVRDERVFPWTTLPFAHPILIQMMGYFVSVGLASHRGTLDPDQWTALTEINWRCLGARDDRRRPDRGRADPVGSDGSPDFDFTIFDEAGAPLYRLAGKGVVFRNRDFEGWRAKNKNRIMALPEPLDFEFADPDAAEVASAAQCFVSPRVSTSPPAVDALLTAKSGFPPAHPFHDGSGDHVNSSHQADAADQAARVMFPELRGAICRRGTIRFKGYVELERPFRLIAGALELRDQALTLAISQGGRDCSEVAMAFEGGAKAA